MTFQFLDLRPVTGISPRRVSGRSRLGGVATTGAWSAAGI
jgi:hypothetical protein